MNPLERDVDMAGSKEKEKITATQHEDEEKEKDEFLKELDAMDENKEKREKERRKVEEKLPSIGESMEEKINIGGIELTPESTLKEMRKACEILGVGKTGSKAQVWKRMKQAVATSKLKELVEISKTIDEEFSREPKGEKRPEPPSEEERRLHELTHMPKADWRESCTATREAEKITLKYLRRSMKHHWSVWISSLLEQEMQRIQRNQRTTLAISLVMVDQETQFVRVIPVPTKEATAYLC